MDYDPDSDIASFIRMLDAAGADYCIETCKDWFYEDYTLEGNPLITVEGNFYDYLEILFTKDGRLFDMRSHVADRYPSTKVAREHEEKRK